MAASIPELLSPAGGEEALRAAVNNGADAVYLGGKSFSARARGENFDREGLARAVEYAHLRGVKVYVAVNTLLADQELEAIADYLRFLWRQGVDALIVQDIGLWYLLRQVLPQMPLHVSTQATVTATGAASLFYQAGAGRIVLARELSLPEIAEVHRAVPGVELEVFVHGAMCFSYSGQCLFSSLVGGRSGNRGWCAQPCRLAYELLRDEGREEAAGHLLSTKDLNLLPWLGELARAGVAALKIEGRLKRPEYVAVVTGVYRRALDAYAADPEEYAVVREWQRNLEQIFSRGFTSGYLLANQGTELMSYDRPNNRGLYLGRVQEVDRERLLAWIRLEDASLAVGDGLEFWVSHGGRRGLEVNRLQLGDRQVQVAPAGSRVGVAVPAGVAPGDRVFKTADAALLERARRSYRDPSAGQRVPLYLDVRGWPGQALTARARDDRGHQSEAQTRVPGQVPERYALDPESLRIQFGRLGGTAFYLADLEANLPEPVMYPVSQLNLLRRQLVADMTEQRLGEYSRPELEASEFAAQCRRVRTNLPVPPPANQEPETKLTVKVSYPRAALAAMETGADIIYFGGERFASGPGFSRQEVAEVFAAGRREGRPVIYSLPRLWLVQEETAVRHALEAAVAWGPAGILTGNLSGIKLAREVAPGLPIYGDYPLNIYNDLAIGFCYQMGLHQVTLSPEMTLAQIGALDWLARGYPLECLAHGHLPLMVSQSCVPGAVCGGRTAQQRCSRPCRTHTFSLRDRLGLVFPVETDQFCRQHIFNAKGLCLVEDLPRLLRLGVRRLRLELTRDSSERVGRIVRIYRKALDDLAAGEDAENFALWAAQARGELGSLSPQGLTKGHYYRGVL
ncbi:MAG: U32 family peptidase [Clostridia bacterium]|nr:MAG: U32 family peptidase [Clostridia bacterium]